MWLLAIRVDDGWCSFIRIENGFAREHTIYQKMGTECLSIPLQLFSHSRAILTLFTREILKFSGPRAIVG